MVRKYFPITLIALSLIILALVSGQGNAQQAYPTKPVELVAAGNPGGGLDIHARAIEQAMTAEKMLDKPFTIAHKGGGGGNITTSYLMCWGSTATASS
jgi:putative tricarboxylic transport membrane protein